MKRILVVGGSKGIGQAVITKGLNQGMLMVNISRSVPIEANDHLTHYACDVQNDELPEVGELSGLVYCPGSILLKPIGSLKEADFVADFAINVLGAVRCIQKYHRSMKEADDASIVMFSSVAASLGMPYHSSVAAAKGAIEGLTKSLAAELAPKIRVNCLALTLTDTPLAAGLLKNDEARERLALRHPLKRILQPKEVASMVHFLLSENALNMTGQVIQMDAGMNTIKL